MMMENEELRSLLLEIEKKVDSYPIKKTLQHIWASLLAGLLLAILIGFFTSWRLATDYQIKNKEELKFLKLNINLNWEIDDYNFNLLSKKTNLELYKHNKIKDVQ